MQIEWICISFSVMHMQMLFEICEFSAFDNSEVSYVCTDTSFLLHSLISFHSLPFSHLIFIFLSQRVCIGGIPIESILG